MPHVTCYERTHDPGISGAVGPRPGPRHEPCLGCRGNGPWPPRPGSYHPPYVRPHEVGLPERMPQVGSSSITSRETPVGLFFLYWARRPEPARLIESAKEVDVSGVHVVRVGAPNARSEGTVSTKVKGWPGSRPFVAPPRSSGTLRTVWLVVPPVPDLGNRLRCSSLSRRAASVRSRSTRACHRTAASVRHAPTAAAMPPTAATMSPFQPV